MASKLISRKTNALMAAGTVVSVWTLYSLVDAKLFNEYDRSFVKAFFRPQLGNVVQRAFCFAVIVFGIYFIHRTVNKMRIIKYQADNREAIMKNAFENTALGMCITRMDRSYIALNKAYCDIIGCSEEEMMNRSFQDFCHPEDRNMDEDKVRRMLDGEIDAFTSTKRYLHKKGHLIWVHATVSLVRDEEGKPKNFVAQAQDITSLVETQQLLQKAKEEAEVLAVTDYLTGCLNRRAFVERFTQEFERAKRDQSTVSLLLVDIDHFKAVNDTFGHMAGDYALQQFSSCLKRSTRPYDFVGRFGGEEFVVCLPNTGIQDAAAVAERMKSSVKAMDIVYKDKHIRLTGSFGIAALNKAADESSDSLISRADNAMYEAKTKRDAICISQ